MQKDRLIKDDDCEAKDESLRPGEFKNLLDSFVVLYKYIKVHQRYESHALEFKCMYPSIS
jgi:hypothetical protein